jgi:hypothetical protein
VSNLLARASEQGGWEPGIGDPTFFGWLAVFCYFGAAYLAYRAGKMERGLQPRSSEMAHGWSRLARDAMEKIRASLKDPSRILMPGYSSTASQVLLPTFWFALCGVLVFLGVNKQLDLQSCFTQVGRDMAKSEGWYEKRRMVQGVFVVVMAVLGMLIIATSYWYVHAAWRRYRIAFFGIIYLVTFVVIRAASFHHIDVFLKSGVGGLYFNHILELGGILFIGYAAWNATRQLLRQPLKAFEKTVRIR